MTESARPPSPIACLLGMLRDPESVRRTYGWCRSVHPPFPQAGGPLFLVRTLFLAGIAVPYAGTVEAQVSALRCHGWRIVSPFDEDPASGDVYFTRAREGGSYTSHIGFVVKTHRQGEEVRADYLLAADNNCGKECRPYRIELGEAGWFSLLRWQGGG